MTLDPHGRGQFHTSISFVIGKLRGSLYFQEDRHEVTNVYTSRFFRRSNRSLFLHLHLKVIFLS